MNSRLLTWATIVGTFLIAVGMATASVVYVVTLRDEAAASTRFDSEARSLITDLRIDAKETKTDVSWIRHFLEHPPAGKEPPRTASIDP